MKSVILICVFLFGSICPSFSQVNDAAINKTISFCLSRVHKFSAPDEFSARFYKEFDAYYNPVTKEVKNNAYRNGDSGPKFQFEKCMTEQGLPLGFGTSK